MSTYLHCSTCYSGQSQPLKLVPWFLQRLHGLLYITLVANNFPGSSSAEKKDFSLYLGRALEPSAWWEVLTFHSLSLSVTCSSRLERWLVGLGLEFVNVIIITEMDGCRRSNKSQSIIDVDICRWIVGWMNKPLFVELYPYCIF
jgi:hypothetical protein